MQCPAQFKGRAAWSSTAAVSVAALQKVGLEDGFQHLRRTRLQNLVRDRGNTQGTPSGRALRDVAPPDQSGMIALLLQVLGQTGHIVGKFLCKRLVVNAVHTGSRLLVQMAEAPVQIAFVQQPVEVAEPMPGTGFGSLRYSPQ